MVLDLTGNEDYGKPQGGNKIKEIKDNSWIGVSLDAQPVESGRIIVSNILLYR
jgi:hypothetical protein